MAAVKRMRFATFLREKKLSTSVKNDAYSWGWKHVQQEIHKRQKQPHFLLRTPKRVTADSPWQNEMGEKRKEGDTIAGDFIHLGSKKKNTDKIGKQAAP